MLAAVKPKNKLAQLFKANSQNGRGNEDNGHGQGGGQLDNEGMKTRSYWQKWAEQAVKGIMESIHQTEEELRVKQSLYSGRIGREPRRFPSEESIATDISMLTCSSLEKEEQKAAKKRRKKKSVEKREGPKTDWVKMAREKKAFVLNKLMRKGNGMLDAYVGGNSGADVMSSEERSLLTRAAYSRGLVGNTKSQSTENVIRRPFPLRARSEIKAKLPHSAARRVNQSESPRLITHDMEPTQRSHSVTIKSRGARSTRKPLPPPTPFAHPPRLPSASSALVNGVEMPNPEHDEELMTKLQATIDCLQKTTGYGDACDALSAIPDERGRYTDVDYARIPRYPQNVRVAPQLSNVICGEIRQRVTRPKKLHVKVNDLNKWDAINPHIDRAHQNLLIFNWLNSLDEGQYADDKAPSIYDLEEGVAPNLTFYPKIFNELMAGVSASSTVQPTEGSSIRSSHDNLDDELADLYEEWGSEAPEGSQERADDLPNAQ